jgi:hypothetical protein
VIGRAFGLVAALVAAAGCEAPGDVTLGSDARDAGTVRADVVSTDVVVADVVVADVGAASPDVGVMPSADAGMLPPRVCMVSAECVGACPPTMGQCVCALTPMGLRCAPTCMMTMDCPPGPQGAALQCRMGVCLP